MTVNGLDDCGMLTKTVSKTCQIFVVLFIFENVDFLE